MTTHTSERPPVAVPARFPGRYLSVTSSKRAGHLRGRLGAADRAALVITP